MDSVRVCLAGLGFGLLVAALLDLPVRVAGIVEIDPVPSPGVRIGMLVIGVATLLLTIVIPRGRRRRGVRYVCGVLFTSMLATFGVIVAGTLSFPFVARQIGAWGSGGHWRGHLDYQNVGPHDVDLYIDPGTPELMSSGRLTVHLANGKDCVFSLEDFTIPPAHRMVMKTREESTDKACDSGNGSELNITPRDGSNRVLELKVKNSEPFPIATGVATAAPT
ncbi:hypothetical protein [Sphaerisporangium aureirubrum]|uniref:Uncharacterized protein n=1 Tax=Sphaerisporangium aureirubrum TaxID=1544736 RepID=A0ABW1NGF3_9ACTN